MKLKDWYVVVMVVSLLATFAASEFELGWICFVPGLLVVSWLMYLVILSNKNPPSYIASGDFVAYPSVSISIILKHTTPSACLGLEVVYWLTYAQRLQYTAFAAIRASQAIYRCCAL